MKAGTTSLYHYLAGHPDVFMPSVKELDFFVEAANWRRGWDWYAKHFEDADGARAVGEASTAYSKHPVVGGVPERVAAALPDCKLVYVVRDPIDRIRSHYEHRVAIGTERAPLELAVIEDPIYVVCSRYASQIERYLDHFPREQILLITAERLRHARAVTVEQVFGFLGVDADVVPPTLQVEYYRTTGRARYPPFVGALRHALKTHVPAAKRAKELVDAGLPRVLGRRGPSDAPTALAIPRDTRRRLVDLLQDDVDRLGGYLTDGLEDWSVRPHAIP